VTTLASRLGYANPPGRPCRPLCTPTSPGHAPREAQLRPGEQRRASATVAGEVVSPVMAGAASPRAAVAGRRLPHCPAPSICMRFGWLTVTAAATWGGNLPYAWPSGFFWDAAGFLLPVLTYRERRRYWLQQKVTVPATRRTVPRSSRRSPCPLPGWRCNKENLGQCEEWNGLRRQEVSHEAYQCLARCM